MKRSRKRRKEGKYIITRNRRRNDETQKNAKRKYLKEGQPKVNKRKKLKNIKRSHHIRIQSERSDKKHKKR